MPASPSISGRADTGISSALSSGRIANPLDGYAICVYHVNLSSHRKVFRAAGPSIQAVTARPSRALSLRPNHPRKETKSLQILCRSRSVSVTCRKLSPLDQGSGALFEKLDRCETPKSPPKTLVSVLPSSAARAARCRWPGPRRGRGGRQRACRCWRSGECLNAPTSRSRP